MKKVILFLMVLFSFSNIFAGWVNLSDILDPKINPVLNSFISNIESNTLDKKIEIYGIIVWKLNSINADKLNENQKYILDKFINKVNQRYNLLSQNDNKNCLLDECVAKGTILKENWNYLVWEISKLVDNTEITYKYTISKNKDFLKIEKSEFMSNKTTIITKIWNFYIKSIDDAWCWWSNIDQKLYDKDANEIKWFIPPIDNFNNSIKIWNLKYIPSLVWKWWFGQPLDSFNDFTIFEENDNYKIYKNSIDFQSYAENIVFNESKKLFKSYIANYENYPWVYIFYETFEDIWEPIRVVYLWTDKKYLEKNIKANWDYYDLDITNKIIWYYGKQSIDKWIFNKNWDRIYSIDKSKIPYFRVKKISEKWYYLVNIKNWDYLQVFAEMCKPVVYYYSKNKEKNTLTLNLKKWDYFTKLIPELDINSSWNFASEDDKVIVDNKKYDYLYYSLVTTGYNHNFDWYVVKWDEIVKFFEDKLTKINFLDKEKADFIDFWKEEYENWKYYFVSFKYKEELDKIIKLDFKNKVDNEFRVLLDSYEILDYNEQKYKQFLYKNAGSNFDKFLIKRFERWYTDNEVFEWGWVLRKENETIIK